MSTSTTYARQPYTKRPVPATYDAGWVSTELGTIARAIPPSTSRTTKVNDIPTGQDSVVLYDATHGPITVTLPQPGQVHDLRLVLKKTDASTNPVHIVGTVDATVNPVLSTQYQSLTIQSSGSAWLILATT
jgi:hypothetical protein